MCAQPCFLMLLGCEWSMHFIASRYLLQGRQIFEKFHLKIGNKRVNEVSPILQISLHTSSSYESSLSCAYEFIQLYYDAGLGDPLRWNEGHSARCQWPGVYLSLVKELYPCLIFTPVFATTSILPLLSCLGSDLYSDQCHSRREVLQY